MRVLGLVILTLAAGCAGEDDLPYRGPGGGGHGGTELGPDAEPGAPDGMPTGTLTGQVCVILDWSAPFACADVPLSHQVQITDLATGGMTTTSDNSGLFTLPLTTSGATIRVGGEVGDLLESTQSVHVATAPVKAPVVDEGLWDATLAALLETQTEGAGVVYVVDPNGPVADAVVVFTTGVPVNARTIYDDGAGGFDTNAVRTGADGAALMLDIQNVGVRAVLDDGRSGSVFLNTGSLEVGIATITLPAPPP